MSPKFVTRFTSDSDSARYLHIHVHAVAGKQTVVTFLFSEDPTLPEGYSRTVGPAMKPILTKAHKDIMKSFQCEAHRG